MSQSSHSASKHQGSRRPRALGLALLLLALAFPTTAKTLAAATVAGVLGAGAALITPLLVLAAAVYLLRAAPVTSRRAITAFAGAGVACVLIPAT